MGLVQVLTDPRTTLAQSLNAMLTAELTDNAGWELLAQLAEEAGESELTGKFLGALSQEQEHLLVVKAWLPRWCPNRQEAWPCRAATSHLLINSSPHQPITPYRQEHNMAINLLQDKGVPLSRQSLHVERHGGQADQQARRRRLHARAHHPHERAGTGFAAH
jgi:hypothetical protein